MERAKPVNWSEVEFCFARIIQTALQSLAQMVAIRFPSASKIWTVARTSEAVGGGELYRCR